MKTFLAASLILVGMTTAVAIPATSADPVRILPYNWEYQITSLQGPGCPDMGKVSATGCGTRLTYGQNTMDGSEIYYWHVAYPYMRAKLGDDDYTWCDTELSYTEYVDAANNKGDFYRLRLHKNGTHVLATYDLDEGVKATWTVTYDTGHGNEITDTVTVNGPFKSDPRISDTINSPVSKNEEIYKLPKCGAGKIKFRTELSVEGKKGKKGVATSEQISVDGKADYYGAQVGWSYDWEKCITSDV